MNRSLIATVSVGALVFAVFMLQGGTVADQKNWLTDAGYTAATHAATCPVRISSDCVDAGRQAGLNVHRNDRLRFPVAIRADGGFRDVQLPPMNGGLAGACIEVVDWGDCTLSTNPAQVTSVSALIGQQLPFDLVGVVRKCVRPNYDAGLMCFRQYPDGGTFSFGDFNVYPRTEAANPNDCMSVECSVLSGQDPLDPEVL